MSEALNSYEYLKRLHESYKKETTLTGMINSYRVISEDYNKVNKQETKFEYSSYDYNECDEQEQYDFFTNELQFVECLVTNTIHDKVGVVQNWMYIYNLLYNPDYKIVEKINRRVIYPTSSNNRPIGEISYQLWNGLQIIDLDIKDIELSNKLKPIIFDELKRFNWFLGICKSSSGKGLHIWTKITPISVEVNNKKIEYLCNFRHKYSYVYVILDKYAKQLGYSKEQILSFMDMAMSKPQQGAFIAYDKALLNTNFKDLRLDVNFEGAFDCGVTSVDWIAHPELKQIFNKLEWFNNDSFNSETNVKIKDISNLQERNEKKAKGPKHYKYAQRWQLANTLTNLFGEDSAFKVMCEICKETSTQEIRSVVKTAAIHNKPISVWAIKELNTVHGFNLKIKCDAVFGEQTSELENELANSAINQDPTRIINDKTDQVQLFIKSNQYLSHIKDDIIANLSHITLLEAGAGYGKTEMIKSLKAKTLLILPFTSTIKAKVEASETTKDWLYYYGSKRPDTADLMGDKNMSMTIDKFSRLNIYELDTADFEYIVIDESHLLFTSSYRDVMCPCIQRLANCKAKVIMMTGTPTGEKIFFPNIKHIKVKKEETRIKEFNLHFVPTRSEQMVEMTKSMANDIMNGIRILFPTNKGVTYYEEIVGLVQEHLSEKRFGREIKSFYYKKSNYGDQSMEDINRASTVGENDIICCSTYLSVGVDICDKGRFSIYFDEIWISQDIEQFANRIRNNDLYVKMFLPKMRSGIPIAEYNYCDPLDLEFDRKDLLLARDLVRTCNDMLERNQEESKYSPLISSLISANRYLKYDENECKYFIDETTYKLNIFEERYSEYAKQLEVLKRSIREDYGYSINIYDSNNEMSEDKVEWLNDYIKECKNKRFNEVTAETMEFLAHIDDSNIDKYRDLLRGNYELFKDEKYEIDRIENKLYTKSIEILEKNAPIVISLYKYYDCDTIRDIYDFCTETKSNRINFSKLQRIRQFANIQNAISKKRLDFPMYRFITDMRKWANDNPYQTKQDIEMFVATLSAKYCNSIEDVVVEDTQYLEEINELVKDLWNVIIIQSKPRKGIINIKPFELLWETKQQLNNIYGDVKTQTFFLEQLLGEAHDEETEETIKETLPDLPHTRKLKLEDIEDEINNVVSKPFDYDVFSKIDGSNERFLRKQENTNQLRDNIFKLVENQQVENNDVTNDNFPSELPF
jgi:hypothetical protein